MNIISCFITGHRPNRFSFKYNEDYTLCKKIKKQLEEQIILHYEHYGVRQVYVGGALGVDTWAAEIVLGLRKLTKYNDLKLFLAIPFPEQDSKFDYQQKKRYHRILEECDDSTTICSKYTPDAYKHRNYYMVDHAQYGIAVYDNDRSVRSGTGQTVNYAYKLNRKITFIHPDTSEAYIL